VEVLIIVLGILQCSFYIYIYLRIYNGPQGSQRNLSVSDVGSGTVLVVWLPAVLKISLIAHSCQFSRIHIMVVENIRSQKRYTL